jgi:monofunctional biosynthetic peptidoglycan transglycosylase
MSAYRHQPPELTNFMKYRMAQAKKAGQAYTASYTYIPLNDISPSLIRAVLYAEDSGFYQHHGVDLKALLTSSIENLRHRKIIWGGSTITMQLCKNLFLSPQKTIWRKYEEMVLAMRMERTLPKTRILELYLNLIEWGPEIFGADNAAHYYFQKSARDLDEAESSFLASIIMNPRLYRKDRPSPFFTARQQWIHYYMVTGQQSPPSPDALLEESIEPDIRPEETPAPAAELSKDMPLMIDKELLVTKTSSVVLPTMNVTGAPVRI